MAIAAPSAPRTRRAPATKRAAAPPRSRLAVVSARRLAERAQRRRARVMALIAASFVAVGLLVVVSGQALVASQQLHLDNLQTQLTTATSTNESLELQRAQLTAPPTILEIVEQKLHMVSPATVSYLSPVSVGETVAEAAARAK